MAFTVKETSIEYFNLSSVNNEAALKKQYRKLVQKYHPDNNGDPEIFKRITEEYKKIKDNQLYIKKIRDKFFTNPDIYNSKSNNFYKNNKGYSNQYKRRNNRKPESEVFDTIKDFKRKYRKNIIIDENNNILFKRNKNGAYNPIEFKHNKDGSIYFQFDGKTYIIKDSSFLNRSKNQQENQQEQQKQQERQQERQKERQQEQQERQKQKQENPNTEQDKRKQDNSKSSPESEQQSGPQPEPRKEERKSDPNHKKDDSDKKWKETVNDEAKKNASKNNIDKTESVAEDATKNIKKPSKGFSTKALGITAAIAIGTGVVLSKSKKNKKESKYSKSKEEKTKKYYRNVMDPKNAMSSYNQEIAANISKYSYANNNITRGIY